MTYTPKYKPEQLRRLESQLEKHKGQITFKDGVYTVTPSLPVDENGKTISPEEIEKLLHKMWSAGYKIVTQEEWEKWIK